MSKISTASAEHYNWNNTCDGWFRLEGDDLTVIEECVPPGMAEVRHRHAAARQFFYALFGEASLEVDGQVQVLGPRERLHVPPGAAHQLRNAGNAEGRFLVISAPNSHGDRSEAPA